MSDLTALTLAQARDLLRKREFSAVALTNAHMAAMGEARTLNAFVLETPDQAQSDGGTGGCSACAAAMPARSPAYRSASRTCSQPKGVRTTACSHILDSFVPTYESTVTAQAAGATAR